MSRWRLASGEIQILQEALSADYGDTNIRLREGEYQYSLAKTIASFQLELSFPNVKDIIRRPYGEEKTNDIKFIRKIQTILKKMEKSNVLSILPKKKPWDLQRYALSSFKFQDVEKNLVIFATDQQIKQSQILLNSLSSRTEQPTATPIIFNIKVFVLIFIVIASYMASIWALTMPVIDFFVFVSAFSIAVACSVMLGKILAKE